MPYKSKEKQNAYIAQWSKEHTKGIYLKLSKNTDADIISWLNGMPNKQGYIKRLIRNDIKKSID